MDFDCRKMIIWNMDREVTLIINKVNIKKLTWMFIKKLLGPKPIGEHFAIRFSYEEIDDRRD